VTSLARPGGNVTGLSVLAPDIVAKGIEILKEAAPSVSRMAVWLDPTNPSQRDTTCTKAGRADPGPPNVRSGPPAAFRFGSLRGLSLGG